ncbi:MAG: hypothetical protein JNK21_00700 [Rhodospirillaceae bacterium]|nr:hypothetical protein [Rhodospirillaceae bacterium]
MNGARKTDGNALAAGLRRAANDNGAVNIGPADPAPSASHLYVGAENTPAPANRNGEMFSHLYVEPDKTCAPTHKTPEHVSSAGPKLTVVTDLPDKLPVLPQEVALIRAYLPDLLARIAANDNEP